MAVKKLSQITFVKQQAESSAIATSTQTVEVSTASEIPSNLAVGTVVKVPDPVTGQVKQYTITTTGQTNVTQMATVEAMDMTVKSLTVESHILPNVNHLLNIGSPDMRFGKIYVNEAMLSTNTLYIGDTPILGTSADTIQIHADPGQSISMYTEGDGVSTTIGSTGKVQLSTNGMNADVTIQASGAGSKVRLGSTNGTDVAGDINLQSNAYVAGNMTITGDLIVNGSKTVMNTQTLSVKDNIIDLNVGETGNGVTAGFAGIKVKRGDYADMVLGFDESDDKFKVGINGSTLETLATREWVNTNASGVTQAYLASLNYASKDYINTLGFIKNTDLPSLGLVSETSLGLRNYATQTYVNQQIASIPASASLTWTTLL